MEAQDFRVQIGASQSSGYEVSLRAPDGGEMTALMRLPLPSAELDALAARIPDAVIASSVPVRRSVASDEQPVRQLGSMLFDALLAEGGTGTFAACRNQAEREQKHLRMVLQVRPPELDRLPWEFLFDSREDDYVCLSTPLIRYPQVPAPIRPLQVTAPLRILCMAARPEDQEMLATAAEQRRLQDTLSGLEQAGLLELGWVEGQTWRDLRDAIRRGPWHVFHFIGHGGFDATTQQGTLAMADDAGRTHHLGADDLTMLWRGHPSLRLVLLNACDTGRASTLDPFSSVAGALMRRGVPAVLAMQYQISDGAALEFGRTFYEGLAYRFPVDLSVMQARQAIRLASPGSLEWGTPVLYMRTAEGVLFDLTATAASRTAVGTRPPPAEPPPERPDAEAEAGRQNLYTHALAALYTERWEEAVQAFRALLADGGYKDAKQKLDQAQRGQRLASLYAAAGAAAAAGQWPEAVDHLVLIVSAEPDYRDAQAMLNQARIEQRATSLYAEAVALHSGGQWEAVLAVAERLAALKPDQADPDGLISSARAELEAARRTQAVADAHTERPGHPAVPMATINVVAGVHAVTFSPESDRLAIGCDKHQALVVDLTGRTRLKLRHGSWDQSVRDVAFDPAGRRLATAGDDHIVRIWDAGKHRRLMKVNHDKPALSAVFSSDGLMLATGSADATARIWDAATGRRLLKVTLDNRVPRVTFSPDGRLLATASWDKTARIWDAATGERQLQVTHDNAVMSVVFSPDGRLLATASWDKTARIWDAATGERQLEVGLGDYVWSAAFSPDGRMLATGSNDATVRIWDITTGGQLFVGSHTAAVSCLAFSPDGRMLATGSLDATVQLWRLIGDGNG